MRVFVPIIVSVKRGKEKSVTSPHVLHLIQTGLLSDVRFYSCSSVAIKIPLLLIFPEGKIRLLAPD